MTGTAPETRVGVAGWSYPDWRGRLYPLGGSRQGELATVARLYDCVEINVTFYRYLERAMAERWLGAVAGSPRFLFTTKVPKELTHEKEIEAASLAAGALRLIDGLAPLIEAGRLGAVLLQFPFYFRDEPANRDRIHRLADAFRPLEVAVEVRHPGFFFAPRSSAPSSAESGGSPPLRTLFTGPGSAIEFFERIGVALANIDLPPGRGTVPPTSINTSRLGYVRLHGRNSRSWFDRGAGRDQKYDYLYSPEELMEWAARVRRLSERTERTFVIFNNHFRGQAPANALQFLHLLGQAHPAPPPLLLAAFPELGAEP